MPKLSLDAKTQTLVQNLNQVASTVFGRDLIGVYIHGSLALGSYNPQISDLDYIVVVAERPSATVKLQLMRATFAQLLPHSPAKGLEFHVITQVELRHGRHPFRFELHYSPMHRQAYLDDPQKYVARMQGTDPDLAVHLAVTWQSGIVVTGQPVKDVFVPIPRAAYLDSAWGDVCAAETEIAANPVYTVLNLCRMRAYLVDGQILSKAAGGSYGLAHFDQSYRGVIDWALAQYTGTAVAGGVPDKAELERFARASIAVIGAAVG